MRGQRVRLGLESPGVASLPAKEHNIKAWQESKGESPTIGQTKQRHNSHQEASRPPPPRLNASLHNAYIEQARWWWKQQRCAPVLALYWGIQSRLAVIAQAQIAFLQLAIELYQEKETINAVTSHASLTLMDSSSCPRNSPMTGSFSYYIVQHSRTATQQRGFKAVCLSLSAQCPNYIPRSLQSVYFQTCTLCTYQGSWVTSTQASKFHCVLGTSTSRIFFFLYKGDNKTQLSLA